MSALALPVETSCAERQFWRFPRACRLLTATHYSDVFANRHALRGQLFVLHYRSNTRPGARLGLVIPKKQARTAVLRNAIKRQAREIFRMTSSELPAMDLVLRLNAPVNRPKKVAYAADLQVRAAWRTEIASLFTQLVQKTRP